MKPPVIIAAHNEASMIGRTLAKLNAKHVEPHVMANGCDDNTAEVARTFGAVVYESGEAGKLPALQTVLRSLGERALGPVLYLDADSYPISSGAWSRRMLKAVDTDWPAAASGPIVLDTFSPTGFAYTGKYYIDTFQARRHDTVRFRGANMVTHIKEEAALKRVLELPHIWPGEDCAVELAIKDEGGISKQIISPGAAVVTSARYIAPIMDVVTTGRQEARKRSLQQYASRAADGSIPLGKYLRANKQ